MIDCYEFFRTFAWDDILHLEEAFADAKLHRSSIAAMTKERLTIFFGRPRYVTIHDTNTLQHMHTYTIHTSARALAHDAKKYMKTLLLL
jgi:hypothetical protein